MAKFLLSAVLVVVLLSGVIDAWPRRGNGGRGRWWRGWDSSSEEDSSDEDEEYRGCFRPKVCRLLNTTSQEETLLCNDTVRCSDKDNYSCRRFGQPSSRDTLNGTIDYSYCLPQECTGPDDRDTCGSNRNCTQVTFNNATLFLCLNGSDFIDSGDCFVDDFIYRIFRFRGRFRSRGRWGRAQDVELPTCCGALCKIKFLAAANERGRRRGFRGSWGGRRGRGRGRWSRDAFWSYNYYGGFDYGRKGCANVTAPNSTNTPAPQEPDVVPIIP